MSTFFVKSDASLSIAKDSALDWGDKSSSTVRGGKRMNDESERSGYSARSAFDASTLDSDPTSRYARDCIDGPSMRYDPTTMNHQLVVDDISEDEEEGYNEKIEGKLDASFQSKYAVIKVGSTLWHRQATVVVGLIGIVATASLAIGYAVVNSRPPTKPVLATESEEEINEDQQHLLETAERVVMACSDSRYFEEASECQSLCKSKVCCFEEEQGYMSCDEGQSWDCAVYAGCIALLDGLPSQFVGDYEQ